MYLYGSLFFTTSYYTVYKYRPCTWLNSLNALHELYELHRYFAEYNVHFEMYVGSL